MKTRQTKKLFASFLPAIFFIIILILNNSCQKESASTGSSTIVYTDVNPDSVILVLKTDSFKLDLNNDRIVDFEFDRSLTELCRNDDLGAALYAINLSLTPAGGKNAIMKSGPNLLLDSATAIAPDSMWTTNSELLLYGGIYSMGHCRSAIPAIAGNWLNVSDKYLGFKFSKNNNMYYGWARLSSSYARAPAPYIHLIVAGKLILKDYAFNNIPNQAILAGQTK